MPNQWTRLLRSSTKVLQDALEIKQENLADEMAAIVDRYWKVLAEEIAKGTPQEILVIASRVAFTEMAKELGRIYEEKLTAFLDYTHKRAVNNVIASMPENVLQRFLSEVIPIYAEKPTGSNAQKKTLKTVIFDAKKVNPGQIVRSVISDTTHLGNPDRITYLVNKARLQGKTTGQIATIIRPEVYGVKSTVRRIVRDTTQFAATAEHLGTWTALPQGMVIGYQINAVPRTKYSRLDHLERSGTIYYYDPEKDQKGLSQMPQPPYDMENGQRILKHNCRCYLTPVFAQQYQPLKKSA